MEARKTGEDEKLSVALAIQLRTQGPTPHVAPKDFDADEGVGNGSPRVWHMPLFPSFLSLFGDVARLRTSGANTANHNKSVPSWNLLNFSGGGLNQEGGGGCLGPPSSQGVQPKKQKKKFSAKHSIPLDGHWVCNTTHEAILSLRNGKAALV